MSETFFLIKIFRSPLALGYTRGHFSALVPPEPEAACGGAGGGVAPEPREQGSRDCFLPLMTRDRWQEDPNQRVYVKICFTQVLASRTFPDQVWEWERGADDERLDGCPCHRVRYWIWELRKNKSKKIFVSFRSAGCPTVNQPAPLAGGSNDWGVAKLLSQDRPILKPNTVQGWRTEQQHDKLVSFPICPRPIDDWYVHLIICWLKPYTTLLYFSATWSQVKRATSEIIVKLKK